MPENQNNKGMPMSEFTLANPIFNKSEDQQASLSAFWMPFTANRQFKSSPKMLTTAKGM
ncbi:hypothetical protein [Endozoicomonas montiporae]|uniref:hypothetical protein n=1 Tax=Endozoicomonas montiporae TaxID=1027273 RepID=UPI000AE8C05C|nr:hypothetical protein [Endozoicomonas montiporae]